MRRCASASLPVEARFSMRPFAQQYRGLASRPIPATASTLLAYIFETILRSESGPFGYLTPAPARLFTTSQGAIYARNPLPHPISGLMIRLVNYWLPSRTSRSFGIKTIAHLEPQSVPLQVARSSFAPRSAAKIFRDHSRYGSSFQIRYFLPGSLSFEPLGTTVIMLLEPVAVNEKMQLSSENKCFKMCEL